MTSEPEAGSRAYYAELAADDLANRCAACQPRLEEVEPGLYFRRGPMLERDYFTGKHYPCKHLVELCKDLDSPLFRYEDSHILRNGISVRF